MAQLPKTLIGAKWRGLNSRAAPHLLEEGESPDTVNTAHKDDKVGIVAARRGRAKMASAAYSGNIVGLIPFVYKGVTRLLVATDDGYIYDGAAFWASGTPWTGPTRGHQPVNLDNLGTLSFSEDTQTSSAQALSIDSGLYEAAALVGLPTIVQTQGTNDDEGTLEVKIQLQFNNGAWQDWLKFTDVKSDSYGLTSGSMAASVENAWSALASGTLTGVRATGTQTRDNGTGTMSGSADFSGVDLVLVPLAALSELP
jgi:hypothetical protein